MIVLVGQALANENSALKIGSWRRRSTAPREVRQQETSLEQKVSDFMAKMTFIILPIEDLPGPDSLRGVIERNSIALLSGFNHRATDRPGAGWLGAKSGRERVRKSGLWNNNHVDEGYDPAFLEVVEILVASGG